MRKNKYTAFTLAEMMVVMLIMSIILAAMAPVMTTRNKIDNSSPWRYSPQNASNAYFGAGQAMHALIGQVEATENDNGKLVINTLGSTMSHILFKSNNNILGDLYFSGSSIVLGNRRNASLTIGNENINIGHENWSNASALEGSSNITIGDNSMQALTTGSNNIGIGTTLSNVSTGSDNVAVGDNSLTATTGSGNIAIGGNANQTSNTHSTIAIGRNSSALGLGAIAIGSNRLATENEGAAINGALAGSRESIAIGTAAYAEQIASIAIGESSRATATDAIAIGKETNAQSIGSIAIGNDETISAGIRSIAIGASDANGDRTVALNGETTGANTIAINGVANSQNAVAINGIVDSQNAIAIGEEAKALGMNSVAFGFEAQANAISSIAIGNNSITNRSGAIALGRNAATSGVAGIAIGSIANASGRNSVAIGYNAEASGNRNIAIGENACKYATGSNKICIGANSGPASGDSWAQDDVERVFIGGKSNFNGGPAVLEVHNGSDTRRYRENNTSRETAVVVNGNLIVKGYVFSTLWTKDGADTIAFYGHDGDQMEYFNPRGGSNDYAPYFATEMHGRFYNPHYGRTPVYSDRRLKYVGKENVSGLDKIRQLKVFNYTFKKDKAKEPHVGVIAQDLQKVFPNAVKKGADGFLTIRMEDMFYAVINAIKELDAKYQAQEKRIDALEKRIEKLEANKAK